MRVKKQLLIGILILVCCLCGCANNRQTTQTESAEPSSETAREIEKQQAEEEVQSASGSIFAMDTYMNLACYGDQAQEALDAAIAEIERLDQLLSVGDAGSEISILNRQQEGSLSEDSLIMVKEALRIYETTEGAFDITIYPMMELWGFTTGEHTVPDETSVQETLLLVGSDRLVLDEDNATLTLSEGQGIDLGGIAKGYTSDRLEEIFAEYDLVSAMVSLGGNVYCYGSKTDGTPWRCGIQDPNYEQDGSMMLGVLEVEDEAVITSGAYERNFTDENGTFYHHILDPSDGYPANRGLISVTVVSKNGMMADALSTACYVMGLDKSISYWNTYGDDFDLILMTEDNEVYVTAPLAQRFTSDYPVHVIEKEAS